MSIELPIKNLGDNSLLPKYAYDGDAGLDLCAAETLTLKPFERSIVRCGFAMAVPQGYAGLVLPRSGLASKHGITLINAPGLIDSGYRGEVKVPLVNFDSNSSFKISVGDRIAQLVIIKTDRVHVFEVDDLEPSERDEKGFGSSGIS